MTKPDEVQVLLSGLGLVESPRWKGDRLYVSDWSAGDVISIGLDGASEVVAHVDSLPLCTAFLPDGRLIIVSSGPGLLLRREPDGSLVTQANLGRPGWNDIVVDGRGNAYVNGAGFDPIAGEEFRPGRVVLAAADGTVVDVADDIAFPNGIGDYPGQLDADRGRLVSAQPARVRHPRGRAAGEPAGLGRPRRRRAGWHLPGCRERGVVRRRTEQALCQGRRGWRCHEPSNSTRAASPVCSVASTARPCSSPPRIGETCQNSSHPEAAGWSPPTSTSRGPDGRDPGQGPLRLMGPIPLPEHSTVAEAGRAHPRTGGPEMRMADGGLLELPAVIQGGMGVGVSAWRLARAVARAGQLGVVSGVGARHRAGPAAAGRRCRAATLVGPWPPSRSPRSPSGSSSATSCPGGTRPARRSAGATTRLAARGRQAQELAVVANFVEVWLAKEGHDGLVGVNYLEKIQMADAGRRRTARCSPASTTCSWAPASRARSRACSTALAAARAGAAARRRRGRRGRRTHAVTHRPGGAAGRRRRRPLRRPRFLAIVSSAVLAAYLARDAAIRPDGFVLEGPVAGGHNAPPRGRLMLDARGRAGLRAARRASTCQGRAPSACRSGWPAGRHARSGWPRPAPPAPPASRLARCSRCAATPARPRRCGDAARAARSPAPRGAQRRRTPPRPASRSRSSSCRAPLSDDAVFAERPRLCDLGYLRTPYRPTTAGRLPLPGRAGATVPPQGRLGRGRRRAAAVCATV